jgi:two-component system cell cycle sensor histidine kinase/response regulator CckA
MNTFFTITENTRWLLVDDNEDILHMLAAVLKSFTSAEIECHRSPESALAAFAATPGKYEVVITDFEMPEMDGVEFCQRLLEISPAQKIFLATGSGFFTQETAWHAGFCALLNKPFSFSALKSLLAENNLCQNEMAFA